MIEVDDTSVKHDRDVKGPLYAQAVIPEYWLVNLPDAVIEVYTGPVGGAYQSTKRARRGDTLPLPGGLQGSIDVTGILGEKEK